MRILLAIFLVSFHPIVSAQDEISPIENSGVRTWKLTSGEEIAGAVVGLKQGVAEVQIAEGKTTKVPLAELAEADRRAAMVARVGSSVAVVTRKDSFGEVNGMGSGFVIHKSGWMLTNYHVVAGAAAIQVKFRGIDKPQKAELFSIDREHDVAVLRVTPLPKGIHVVELQSRELPSQGAAVWTIGHPNGLENTVGRGDVNAIRKASSLPPQIRAAFSTAPDDSQWVQTSAVLAHGSSGGPLLNQTGQVLGINTLLAGPQFGFAIHISHARDAYLQAQRGKRLALPVAPSEMEDPNSWVSREMAPVLKAFSEERERLGQSAAGLPRDKVFKQLADIHSKYLQQCVKIASDKPNSWPAVQAMFYGLQFCDVNQHPDSFAKICDLALEHHADSNHIQPILQLVSQHATQQSQKFCRELEKKSGSNNIRFAARASLAMALLRWLHQPGSVALKPIQDARGQLTELIDHFGKDIKREGDITDEVIQRTQQALRQQFAAARLGAPAAEIVGVDIKSDSFKLSEFKGKVVLLDFFTNWCPHCVKMYPFERKLVETLKDSPFALLGIHCESQQVLDRLVKDKVVTWRVWADGDKGPIATQWQVTGFPTMVLVDHNGLVRWQASGAPTDEQLTKLVDQLVKEATAAKADTSE